MKTDEKMMPAEAESLTMADFSPGDIVRFKGKEWRVQGIDDYDEYDFGLLLLDVAEPEDAPDFIDDVFIIATRGSNRRPVAGALRRWCLAWAGGAGGAELVSRGEPEIWPVNQEDEE